MKKMNHTQVLIVGAGPVGLLLAAYLTKFGVAVRIIDKRQRDVSLRRAIAVSMASMNIFESLGIADEIVKQSRQVSNLTMYWEGNRLLNVNFKHLKTNYPYFVHIYQPQIEDILIDYLKDHNVVVERGIDFVSAVQDEQKVSAILEDNQTKCEFFTCDYLIGCDGGNSKVREAFGIGVEVESYDSYFVLADVNLDWKYEGKYQVHYFMNETGYLMVVPGPGEMHRVIGSFLGNDLPKEIDKKFIQNMVDDKGPGGIVIKNLDWHACAGFGHKIAKTGQVGRVFLAGDSYHLFSPVGGINMNIGLQDAQNLAWKLSCALKKQEDAKILDTYVQERGYVIEKVLQASKERTFIITHAPQMDQEGASAYLPGFYNRKHFKYELPLCFAGFDLAYPVDQILIKGQHHLLGKHIANLDWFANSAYSIIARSPVKCTQYSVKNYISSAVEEDMVYLVRPDNYIALVAPREKIDVELREYFKGAYG
jgi:2-polyprenyl-6-methoxyphenol hydroxylase-like FAD-dependent oxidoreductase